MRRKATAPHSTPHGWPSEVVETNMCPRGSGHQCDTGLCSRSWPGFSALHASQPSPAPALSSQLERGSSGGKTWRERSHSHQYSPQMCRISNSSDIGILCHPLSVKVSRMLCYVERTQSAQDIRVIIMDLWQWWPMINVGKWALHFSMWIYAYAEIISSGGSPDASNFTMRAAEAFLSPGQCSAWKWPQNDVILFVRVIGYL